MEVYWWALLLGQKNNRNNRNYNEIIEQFKPHNVMAEQFQYPTKENKNPPTQKCFSPHFLTVGYF